MKNLSLFFVAFFLLNVSIGQCLHELARRSKMVGMAGKELTATPSLQIVCAKNNEEIFDKSGIRYKELIAIEKQSPNNMLYSSAHLNEFGENFFKKYENASESLRKKLKDWTKLDRENQKLLRAEMERKLFQLILHKRRPELAAKTLVYDDQLAELVKQSASRQVDLYFLFLKKSLKQNYLEQVFRIMAHFEKDENLLQNWLLEKYLKTLSSLLVYELIKSNQSLRVINFDEEVKNFTSFKILNPNL